jgi:DUF4097 and DUF4098 domain-containing protein YvlB
MRRWTLVLACLGLGGCDCADLESSNRYQSDFHYSYALNPGGRLEVENFNGAVEITGWDQNQCEITGVKSASTVQMRDRIKIEVQHSPDGIYVRSVRPDGDFHGSMGVHYVIRVPRKTELSRIISSNGSLHVEQIEGRAELKTTNGPVHVEALHGMLNAHTSNGSVTAENVTGAMLLHTSNGPIRAERITAGVEASTSNGSITAHFDDGVAGPAAFSKFETSNGKIDLTVSAPPKSEIRAQTSNSSITLRLPASTAAKIRMATSHGQVRSDFEAEHARAEQHGRHQTLEETIGGGGPLIDLHTTNGSIRVLRL